MTPLDESTMETIIAFTKTLKPLYEDIKVEYSVMGSKDIKNILPIKAPHYFVISSENKDGYLTNVGFIFQQMDLFLSSIGIGSCWLGMARTAEKIDTQLEFVIILAYGKAMDTPYRQENEFKRKSLEEISDKNDKRLEVARLAPSATNSQPWYFVTDGETIHVYCVKLGMIKALVYEKMNKVDMGIALAHLYVANKEEFKFFLLNNTPEIKGYYYIGSVKNISI